MDDYSFQSGPLNNGPPWRWLWVRGFQVISYDESMDQCVMLIPDPRRLIPESHRLLILIGREKESSDLLPTVTAVYSPFGQNKQMGDARLELHGVSILVSILTS